MTRDHPTDPVFGDALTAHQKHPAVPVSEPAKRETMHRFAPIFPVSDLAASLAFYSLLGFTAKEYTGESTAGGYGVARRDAVEPLAAEWREAGAEVG